VLVVPENLVGGAGIQHRQLVNSSQNLFELARENLTPALIPKPLKSFLKRLLDRSRYGFAGLGRDFSR
jgi:hypothetical protein